MDSDAGLWSSSLFLLVVLSTAYVLVVVYLLRAKKAARGAKAVVELVPLPADDRPPAAATGWPPMGSGLTPYVDEGFAAIDAFLSEGSAT